MARRSPAKAVPGVHTIVAVRRPQTQIVVMENEPKLPLPVSQPAKPAPEKEFGGPAGPEPTRYGDWEQKGRCTDF